MKDPFDLTNWQPKLAGLWKKPRDGVAQHRRAAE
jgi:hypothetical protein